MKNNGQDKELYNWGNYPKIKAKQYTPQNNEQIKSIIAESPSIIAQGNGRCYGDANLNSHTISTRRLNKFISFDREEGIIRCEAGVLLSEILESAVPSGYFLPVTPGTKYVSVGGALAADVHGKNHHVDGCFSDHVLSFRLINDEGEIIELYPGDDLFWMTVGGMGLTGVVIDVTLKLKPIQSAYIKHEAIKAENLDEIFSLFEESENWTYTVAWIDCLQQGKHLGRSILYRGEHAEEGDLSEQQKKRPLEIKTKKKKTVPFYFPTFVLNTYTVKIFNFLYYHKQLNKQLKNIIDYDTFFYPLDSILLWNRIYGKKGFIQYQFVIPKEKGREGMQKILETIQKSGQGSFLAVLKLFGKNNQKAYNSFPIEGYTLALDFKLDEKLPALVDKLDELVKIYGGRIYRAKDSMSSAELTNYLKMKETEKFSSVQHKRIKKIN